MLKNKEKNEHEVLEFGPVGPSLCRGNRSAEVVLYIRLTNNGLLKINAQSNVE
jgi:hypothetical protein